LTKEEVDELRLTIDENEENQELRIENQEVENGLLFQNEESTTSEVELPNSEIPKNTLDLFMRDIALMTDADKKTESEEDRNKVVLMTIHAAKGLEFPYVYIVGLEENLFPSQMSLTERADLEEERRLFYVALTRAEKRVTLSYSTTRYKWGNLIYCEPSRFIEELDEKYLDLPAENNGRMFGDEAYPRKQKLSTGKAKETFVQRPVIGKKLVKLNTASKSTSDFDTESLRDLQVGMEVEHDRFGTGKVINMEGAFPNNKATVFFEGIGQKQLLIKFAKLRILN
jgi:DNA helicase-2/ATP-dependent DNA helicase PcrA